MTMIKIDRNVPMPHEAEGTKGRAKYPFATMRVKESFAIKTDHKKNTTNALIKRLKASIWAFKAKHKGMDFWLFPMGKEVRVWRTK